MRLTHLEYFRELCDSIQLLDKELNKEYFPFKDKLLEIYPSEQDIIAEFPCAVLVSKTTKNNLDARFKEKNRIEPVFRDNTKFNRYFVKHFKQEYNYEIHFWINNPSSEIFSDAVNPGVIDQALLYVSVNSSRVYKPTELSIKGIEFKIDVGDTSIETGQASNKAVYNLILNIIIRDGLYSIEEEETMSGYILQIEDPVDIIQK